MYENIILPVVLYGCETWSFTLYEERTQRVLENSVLRKVFWPGEWRRLRNEELRDLYHASHRRTVRVISSRTERCAGHVTFTGDKKVTHKILVRKAGE